MTEIELLVGKMSSVSLFPQYLITCVYLLAKTFFLGQYQTLTAILTGAVQVTVFMVVFYSKDDEMKRKKDTL